MRILVTGGAGFIGSHVADTYLAVGHEVAVLDNLATGNRSNIPAAAKFYEGSITDYAFLTKVFEEFQPEIVNHHAAQASVLVSYENPLLDVTTNVLGTVNLLDHARKADLKKFIMIVSGGTYYGDPDKVPCPETAPHKFGSLYGLSKYVDEEYIWAFRTLYGLKATVLRYANIYGPRQDPRGEAGVCAIFTNRMLAGELMTIRGGGTPSRDYTYVKDVAAANLAALEQGEGESYNIGTGVPTTTRQVFDTIKTATGYSLTPAEAPLVPGEIQATYLDNSKAQRELGWKPVYDFKAGIEETISWFKSRA